MNFWKWMEVYNQSTYNPSGTMVTHVAKKGIFYYCYDSSERILRLNTTTKAIDFLLFFWLS